MIIGITPFKKLGIDNGEKVLSELRQKIKEYNWHPESLSVEKIWLLLDIINRKDLCKFSTLIHRVITGNPLPFLTFEQKDQITFITGAQPKAGTGHKMQTVSVVFSTLRC